MVHRPGLATTTAAPPASAVGGPVGLVVVAVLGIGLRVLGVFASTSSASSSSSSSSSSRTAGRAATGCGATKRGR